jgi:hypothetical protein
MKTNTHTIIESDVNECYLPSGDPIWTLWVEGMGTIYHGPSKAKAEHAFNVADVRRNSPRMSMYRGGMLYMHNGNLTD